MQIGQKTVIFVRVLWTAPPIPRERKEQYAQGYTAVQKAHPATERRLLSILFQSLGQHQANRKLIIQSHSRQVFPTITISQKH